ncbi:bone morphogenetic protein 7 [Plakobranchus ocellatus]|uniref:Bone morphogenetic protein 7 n=1 Tax=Plakobranchus ocellatus TaxID=259542 RepID=A0AAV4D2P3_9GAST|nr:bone morphogenetic protein 7 [Plakobranchus ocellatus]
MGIIALLSLVLAALACQSYAASSFYADNYRGQSVPMGKMARHQQKNVQQDLLELMGLYSKPKPKANKKIIQSASKFMRDLYESLKDLDESGQSAEDTHIHITSRINASALGLDPAKLEGSDVIVSFVNYARKKPFLRHEKDRTFYFDFSEVSVSEQVKGAELRIYKERTTGRELKGQDFTIQLYAFKQGKDWEEKILELQSSLHVTGDTSGWLTLDATQIASDWTLFPYMNLGLYLEVVDRKGKKYHPRDIGIVGRQGPADKQSFLVGYMAMSQHVLERRARSVRARRWTAPDGASYSDNPYAEYSRNGYVMYRSSNNCQKHNLYINFRDIGFDSKFLIAPEGYSAFYCAGDCSFPLGIHMNATNHAIVQTLVHLMTPEQVPKPCCAPTKFGPITLLYYDDNTSVVLQRFRNMIVRACGCH